MSNAYIGTYCISNTQPLGSVRFASFLVSSHKAATHFCVIQTTVNWVRLVENSSLFQSQRGLLMSPENDMIKLIRCKAYYE